MTASAWLAFQKQEKSSPTGARVTSLAGAIFTVMSLRTHLFYRFCTVHHRRSLHWSICVQLRRILALREASAFQNVNSLLMMDRQSQIILFTVTSRLKGYDLKCRHYVTVTNIADSEQTTIGILLCKVKFSDGERM